MIGEMMGSIRLRNAGITFDNIEEAGDRSSSEAVGIVRRLMNDGVSFRGAVVDSVDGLVLISNRGQWRFMSCKCGYDGSGVIDAAKALSLAGFGTVDDVKIKISRGGMESSYIFGSQFI